jgi:adenylate cyclase class 2
VPLEVEQKFRVANLDATALRLLGMGVAVQSPVEEVDLYFQHPARDFALTDEALRIRQKAGTCFLTYKGPKLDPVTKTRREIDLRLPESPATSAAFRELLEALGFRPVAEVRKRSRPARRFRRAGIDRHARRRGPRPPTHPLAG